MIPYQSKTTGMIPFTPGKLPTVKSPTPDLQTKLDTGNYGEQVGGAQLSGVKKIAGSISKGAQDKALGTQQGGLKGFGNSIKGIAEAGFGTVVGASQIALSPITPALSKLTKAITPALRTANPDLAKIYDGLAPKLDALSKAYPDASSLTSDIVNTLLLAVGGGEAKLLEAPIKDALSKEGLATLKGDIKNAMPKDLNPINAIKPKPVTPANLNDYIDKNYSKAIPSSSKKSIALTEGTMANNREAMKLITDNKENLKFSNQAGTYDTGRLPENIVEHAQAVTQTRQNIWDKMSAMLKEKNVSISLDKPLATIKAKIDSLGASASETPYLQALYDKYSKTPMATVDQMNTFIKDLNNDAEPFFKSGSDKAKATSSASVGNLFRDQLDTTAQQIGTPEVSLLRKQYGAMASTEGDIAKALNKQLKGAGGGASGLADLFSGEEIARGIITGNPASITSGVALQATKWYLKWLHDPNRTLANLYSKIDSVTGDAVKSGEKIPRMESSFAPKERAGLPVVKGQVNPVKTPKVINMPGKIGGFDEPQAKNIGVGLNPPKEIKVAGAPEGHYLNIGMNEGLTNTKITEAQIRSALPKDVKILSSKVVKGETEDTFVPKLSRPLTDTEMTTLLTATKQKAIPSLSNGVGKMYGSNEWGDFNPEYFSGVKFKTLKGKIK